MAPERRRARRVLLNPFLVSALVVALATAGWLLYTGGTSSIAQARPGANLLPALDAPSAPAAPAGSVGGWTVNHSGDARASLERVDGTRSENALRLDIARFTSGDVTLTSPRVSVQPGTSYLFKTFATSDADFTLLSRQFHSDGTSTLTQLRNPLERPGNSPFTVSDAFAAGSATTAVQYVIRLASTGTVTLEGAYFEAADDVTVPPAGPPGTNLIPGLLPEGTPAGPADSWSPYSSGESTVASGRGNDENGRYLWTKVANYRSGEAKWQYPPIPVTPDQYFEFGSTYRSDREADILAEFELADGRRVFHNLLTVPAAGQWTTVTEPFQVPDGAKAVMVTLVSHGNGTTAVRDYSLIDITKPGPLRWEQPMVSITFDDGWQSVYDRALPLLDSHGFTSTQYVNASTIETPHFMTARELQQLNTKGHEIAAHSYEHVDLTSIDTGRLDDELRKSQEALTAAGLGTDDLATPFGRSDRQVAWYASKYFTMVRGTDSGINTRQNIDPHDLKVFYVTEETTPDALAAALAETRRVNGWLIIVYHQITDSGTSNTPVAGSHDQTTETDGSTITSDVLAAQLQLIDDSGIQVQPVAAAYSRLNAQ